jgi:hypothetical protein
MSIRRSLGWALIGAGLALSMILLHASWYALFPSTLSERRAAVCVPYYEPWGYCHGLVLVRVVGVLLGAGGITGLTAVAIARGRSQNTAPTTPTTPQLTTPAPAVHVTYCIHDLEYERCNDCRGFWTPEGGRR